MRTYLTAFRLWISIESHLWASNPCLDGPQYCTHAHFCPSILESVTRTKYASTDSYKIRLNDIFSFRRTDNTLHAPKTHHASCIRTLCCFNSYANFCAKKLFSCYYKNKQSFVSVCRSLVWPFPSTWNIGVRSSTPFTTSVRIQAHFFLFDVRRPSSPFLIFFLKYQKSEKAWKLLTAAQNTLVLTKIAGALRSMSSCGSSFMSNSLYWNPNSRGEVSMMKQSINVWQYPSIFLSVATSLHCGINLASHRVTN